MASVFTESRRSMASDLKIRWEGDVPGIAEKRLSLNAFAKPLDLMLTALRRIATQMVSTAMEGEHPRSGRFANVARWIDIEIADIAHNSTGADALVVFHNPPDELNLWGDIPSRATVELLDAIDMESKGHARNGAVRNFLKALPPLNRQVYEYTNATANRRVEIGKIELTSLPPDLPFLKEIEGYLVGVGFEPGKPEIRIKSESQAMPVALSTTEGNIDRAWEIRHERVRTLSVHIANRARLLRLGRSTDAHFVGNAQAVEEHIFKRWDTLLERLAK
jgi:hypothetical protein